MLQIKYSIWTLCEMRYWLPYMPRYVYVFLFQRISCRGWFYWYSTMWNTIDTIFGNEGYLVSDADPSRVSSINQDPNNIFSDFVPLDRFLLFSTSWISFYFIIIIYIKNDVYFKSTVIGWRRFNKSLSNKLKVPQDLLNFVSLGPPYNIVGTRNNMPYQIHKYLTISTHQYKKFNTNLKHTHLTVFISSLSFKVWFYKT